MEQKRKNEYVAKFEQVTTNVLRLRLSESTYVWRLLNDDGSVRETFTLPSVEWLERLVEAAKRLERELLERQTKH